MSDEQHSGPAFDLVVPVFNEEAGLPEFFERLSKLKLNCQPIFVDNASTDNSVALLKSYPGARVIEHGSNEGYGGSLIDGVNSGTNDYIVTIDADCEYPPECIPELIEALNEHAVVYASRFLNEGYAREARMPLLKRSGNHIFSWSFNRLFSQNTTDLYTGCKAYRRSAISGIQFEQKGFEFVLELAVKLVARGCTIQDIAVRFQARSTGTSKMRYLSESLKYFFLLLRYAYRYRRGTLIS